MASPWPCWWRQCQLESLAWHCTERLFRWEQFIIWLAHRWLHTERVQKDQKALKSSTEVHLSALRLPNRHRSILSLIFRATYWIGKHWAGARGAAACRLPRQDNDKWWWSGPAPHGPTERFSLQKLIFSFQLILQVAFLLQPNRSTTTKALIISFPFVCVGGSKQTKRICKLHDDKKQGGITKANRDTKTRLLLLEDSSHKQRLHWNFLFHSLNNKQQILKGAWRPQNRLMAAIQKARCKSIYYARRQSWPHWMNLNETKINIQITFISLHLTGSTLRDTKFYCQLLPGKVLPAALNGIWLIYLTATETMPSGVDLKRQLLPTWVGLSRFSSIFTCSISRSNSSRMRLCRIMMAWAWAACTSWWMGAKRLWSAEFLGPVMVDRTFRRAISEVLCVTFETFAN